MLECVFKLTLRSAMLMRIHHAVSRTSQNLFRVASARDFRCRLERRGPEAQAQIRSDSANQVASDYVSTIATTPRQPVGRISTMSLDKIRETSQACTNPHMTRLSKIKANRSTGQRACSFIRWTKNICPSRHVEAKS